MVNITVIKLALRRLELIIDNTRKITGDLKHDSHIL